MRSRRQHGLARHPDRPGVLQGTWAVTYTDEAEDADIVTFTLTPSGDGMRYCEREPGADESCTTAVLASRGRASDGMVVFEVDAETLLFRLRPPRALLHRPPRRMCVTPSVAKPNPSAATFQR